MYTKDVKKRRNNQNNKEKVGKYNTNKTQTYTTHRHNKV